MGAGRARKRAAAVLAPVVASAFAVGIGASPAGAASAERTDNFNFTSSTTGLVVSCSVSGAFSSTEQPSGGWELSATAYISAANSPECYDGIAHLAAHEANGTDDEFNGGQNYVQVSTTTRSEVTSISYDFYFDGCACYSPEYNAPK